MPRIVALALLGFATLAALASACTTDSRSTARSVLYAPEFRYYEKGEVQTTMHAFAREVLAVEQLLRKEQKTAEDQQAVVAALNRMDEAAAELALSGQGSNHPIFDRYLEDLRRDIAAARVAAGQDPPDYFLAGSITGSCVACHRVTR